MTTPSIEDILAQAENPGYARVSTARVLLRQDLVAAHAELEQRLAAEAATDALRNREPVAPAIAQQLADLEAEMDAAKVPFKFRSIGKRKWADLLRAHPPTRQQLQAMKNLDHNPDTFPIAAIAASAAEPVMTEDEVRRLEQALNNSQFDALWAHCLEANIGGLQAPKSVAAGTILRANAASASTAAREESLDQSSSDE